MIGQSPFVRLNAPTERLVFGSTEAITDVDDLHTIDESSKQVKKDLQQASKLTTTPDIDRLGISGGKVKTDKNFINMISSRVGKSGGGFRVN